MNGLQALAAVMSGKPFDTIRGAYPNARITSGYRGPNHPLTKKNPSSKHALGTPDNPGAIDLAPIPGVRFDDLVSRMKREGLPITGALDEATNPMPWTTGPNWHLSLDPNQVKQPHQMTPAEMQARAAAFSVDIPDTTTGALAQTAMTNALLPAPVAQQMPQAMAQRQAAETAKETGLFKGNDLAAIAGILGDALMAYGGLQPQFAPTMASKSAMEREAELAMERERIKADAKAREPIEHTNQSGDVVRINPITGETEILYMDPVGKPQWQRYTDPATGAITIENMGGAPRPEADDIQDLLANPDLKGDFDAEFGPGAADYILRRYGGTR